MFRTHDSPAPGLADPAIRCHTRYTLLYPDWRGYVIAFFSLVFIANLYLSLYARVKVGITSEKHSIELKHQQIRQAD